jgi:hypothetical protein
VGGAGGFRKKKKATTEGIPNSKKEGSGDYYHNAKLSIKTCKSRLKTTLLKALKEKEGFDHVENPNNDEGKELCLIFHTATIHTCKKIGTHSTWGCGPRRDCTSSIASSLKDKITFSATECINALSPLTLVPMQKPIRWQIWYSLKLHNRLDIPYFTII